jgi:Ca2+-binding EF-hand superfamily protein
MEADADPNKSGYISQSDYTKQIYKAVELSSASSANSRKAIKNMTDNINLLLGDVVDKNKTISPEDFRHIMTRVGEKLSNEEYDDLFASLDTSSGRVSFDNVINSLML